MKKAKIFLIALALCLSLGLAGCSLPGTGGSDDQEIVFTVPANINVTTEEILNLLNGVVCTDEKGESVIDDITISSLIPIDSEGKPTQAGTYQVKYQVTIGDEVLTKYVTVVVTFVAPETDDMIVNGDFELNTVDPFTKSDIDGGVSTMSVVEVESNKVLQLDITGVSWQQAFPRIEYALAENEVTLDSTKYYELSFDAYANEARAMHVQLGQLLAEDPWFLMALNEEKFYDLTTEKANYTWRFQVDPSHANADMSALSFTFEFGTMPASTAGSAATTVFMDNIKLVEVNDLGADTTAPVITLPTSNLLYIGDAFDAATAAKVADARDANPTLTIDAEASVLPALVDGKLTTAGEYSVKYVAKDAAGNESTAIWTFSVAEKPVGANGFAIGTVANGGETDLKDPTEALVWYDQGWCGSTVSCQYGLENGVISITSDQNGAAAAWFSTQLFAWSLPVEKGGLYELSYTIKLVSGSGLVNINGAGVTLATGVAYEYKGDAQLIAGGKALVSIQFGVDPTVDPASPGHIGPFQAEISNFSLVLKEESAATWIGYGMTVNEGAAGVSIEYANTPSEWWNNNTQHDILAEDVQSGAEGYKFTFKGIAGHSYVFKIEGGGKNVESPAQVATGEVQEVVLDLSAFTKAEIAAMTKLVVFSTGAGESGTLLITKHEYVMPVLDWTGYGMGVELTEDGTVLTYPVTPSSWWDNNAQHTIAAPEAHDGYKFVFQGVAGQTYLFKIEGGGQQKEVPMVADGSVQEIIIDLSSYTPEQKAGLNLLVVFCQSSGEEGSLTLVEYGYYDAPKWSPVETAGDSIKVEIVEETINVTYANVDINSWHHVYIDLPNGVDADVTKVVFNAILTSGHEYLFKIEGGGQQKEVGGIIGTGEAQNIEIDLSTFTAAQKAGFNKLVIFPRTSNAEGSMSFSVDFYSPVPESAWVGAGMTTAIVGGEDVITYADTSANWWEKNSTLAIAEPEVHEAYKFVFIGVAGQSYVFKLEGTTSVEQTIVADGSQQELLIDLTSYSEEQILSMNKLVFFSSTAGASGSVTLISWGYYDAPKWTPVVGAGDSIIVSYNENKVVVDYVGVNTNDWHHVFLNLENGIPADATKIVFTFIGSESHTYLFKFEGAAVAEQSAIGTGVEQTVELDVSGLTAAQKAGITKLVIFPQSSPAAGNLTFEVSYFIPLNTEITLLESNKGTFYNDQYISMHIEADFISGDFVATDYTYSLTCDSFATINNIVASRFGTENRMELQFHLGAAYAANAQYDFELAVMKGEELVGECTFSISRGWKADNNTSYVVSDVEGGEVAFIYSDVVLDSWENIQKAMTGIPAATKTVIFEFVGTAGHVYKIKIEGSRNIEIDVTATGEVQTGKIDISGFSEADKAGVNKLVIFVRSAGTGTCTIQSITYSEEEMTDVIPWAVCDGAGTSMILDEADGIITLGYSNVDINSWHHIYLNTPKGVAEDVSSIIFSFVGTAGHEYLFKIEPGAAIEKAVTATGELQTVELNLASVTAAQKAAYTKLIVFVRSGGVEGSLVINNIEYSTATPEIEVTARVNEFYGNQFTTIVIGGLAQADKANYTYELTSPSFPGCAHQNGPYNYGVTEIGYQFNLGQAYSAGVHEFTLTVKQGDTIIDTVVFSGTVN